MDVARILGENNDVRIKHLDQEPYVEDFVSPEVGICKTSKEMIIVGWREEILDQNEYLSDEYHDGEYSEYRKYFFQIQDIVEEENRIQEIRDFFDSEHEKYRAVKIARPDSSDEFRPLTLEFALPRNKEEIVIEFLDHYWVAVKDLDESTVSLLDIDRFKFEKILKFRGE